MLSIIFLWVIVPLSIYFGLIFFNNVILTFILFYGIICLLIPIVDLMIIQKKNIKEYFHYLGFRNFKKTLIPSTIVGIIFCSSIFLFFVFLEKYIMNIDQMQGILDN